MITNRRVQHLPDSARWRKNTRQPRNSAPVGAIMSNMIGVCPECHGQLLSMRAAATSVAIVVFKGK